MYYKDLTGQKIDMLTILQRIKKDGRTYYKCKCDCGTITLIRGDSLTKKGVKNKSCGCLSKARLFKSKDITNKRFGRLVALKNTEKQDKSNGAYIWLCKCDCGNFKDVSITNLNKGKVTSCGCLLKESRSKNGKKIMDHLVKKNIVDNTNIPVIKRRKLLTSNSSGYTGVCYNKSKDLWVSTIQFQNKIYYLGSYKNKEDAIKSRQEGKKKYHLKFLENIGDENT